MHKILVIDDNAAILQLLEQFLHQEGYAVLTASCASDALIIIEKTIPDLIVIDVGLPGMDGVELCRQMRAKPKLKNVPILFLTAQDTAASVVKALDAGGDDYMSKPFAVRELSARIRAHLRRSSGTGELPTLRVVFSSRQVFLNGLEVTLTPVEFDLLHYLCNAPDKWHTAQVLLASVWQYPEKIGDEALVRNHIRNLRRKLEDNPNRPTIILSRHGRGYSLRARVER